MFFLCQQQIDKNSADFPDDLCVCHPGGVFRDFLEGLVENLNVADVDLQKKRKYSAESVCETETELKDDICLLDFYQNSSMPLSYTVDYIYMQ